ncbi:MAG: class I adenylate-forming enzyme family protein [Acidimicrobiia bacterium]
MAGGVPEDLANVEAELLAPGGLFETAEEDVLGERMTVFKNRLHSLREIVAASVGHGDRDYLVFTDGVSERRFTFAGHERLVASAAAAMRERFGIGPGDRVAILGANSPEWIVAFWAATSLGAIAVGLNGWWTGPEIRYGLDDCEPALLVADEARLARLGGADPGVPTVVMERDTEALWHHDPDAALPDVPIAEDDPALMLYTSGTTGRPKGAVHSHRNVIALLGLNFFHGLRMMMVDPPRADEPPNCQLMTSPLFHVSGLHNGAVAFLLGGVKSVWLPGRFDPAVALAVIDREQVTGWSFTETLLHRLLHHPDVAKYDLSSVRQCGGGGSPISAALQRRAREVFPRARASLAVGYGLTESSALASINVGEELERFPTSAGRPLPTIELEVRGPEGTALPDGEEGEVCVRGPVVMLEYWRRPEDTATVIGPHRWLHTGDVGCLEDGRIFLSSRQRDLILRGGENVYPVEIEHRLAEHPGVAEVAVVGVEDPEFGQAVKAVVVPRAGAVLEPDGLAAWVGSHLAYFKVPSVWEIRAEPLPRNAAGKVLKAVLVGDEPSAFVEE